MESLDLKQIEARTYDITTPELIAAIGLRHDLAVLFTSNPKAEVPGEMPMHVIVVGRDCVGDPRRRLAALRIARTAIDFTVVQIENGLPG
jgi:hypothetical protein